MGDEIPEIRWSNELSLIKSKGYDSWETYLKSIYHKEPDGTISRREKK
jgi:hypothetical protein